MSDLTTLKEEIMALENKYHGRPTKFVCILACPATKLEVSSGDIANNNGICPECGSTATKDHLIKIIGHYLGPRLADTNHGLIVLPELKIGFISLEDYQNMPADMFATEQETRLYDVKMAVRAKKIAERRFRTQISFL